MKKHVLYLLIAVSMVLGLVLPAAAADTTLLYDEADLLTDSEEVALLAELEGLSSYAQMDVVVLTVNTLSGYTPMEYADDFYDYNGYGYGVNRDGLLLLVSMEERDWWISTRGYAIHVFTDAGIDYIGEQITPYLSAGLYAEAFHTFVDLCSAFAEQAAAGDPYDIQNLPGYDTSVGFNAGSALVISAVVGLLIALIYTGSLKGQLRSVRAQNAASDYVKKNSLNVTAARDFFLYRHVDRTIRQTSSGSGGGSHIHTSSSGASHGGRGGKF